MLDKIKGHVIAWTTGAALTLAMLRFVTPNFVDFIIDWLTVGLVYVAARLSKSTK